MKERVKLLSIIEVETMCRQQKKVAQTMISVF